MDDLERFLEAERERRKTDRERELERELLVIANNHRRALVEESAPLYEELAQIEASKSPMPVVIDGKVYQYTGRKQ